MAKIMATIFLVVSLTVQVFGANIGLEGSELPSSLSNNMGNTESPMAEPPKIVNLTTVTNGTSSMTTTDKMPTMLTTKSSATSKANSTDTTTTEMTPTAQPSVAGASPVITTSLMTLIPLIIGYTFLV